MKEITIKKVHDRKNLATECVELTVNQDVKLSEFALTDMTFSPEGNLSNVHRHFFKFPNDHYAHAGDVIKVYTKVGKDDISRTGTNTQFNYFMGLDASIWNNDGDIATLWRVTVVHKVMVNK